MPSIVTLILVSAALAAGLIFAPISSYASAYIVLGASLVGAVMLRQRLGPILRHPAYLAVFAALALLAVTLPFVWRGPDDLLLPVALLPVPVGLGLVALIEIEPRFGSPLFIGSFSLIATIVALLAGLEDVYVRGLTRAGAGNNPIHFADLTVTLGFFSLVGLFGTQKLWRVVFLAGPVLGLEVVLLTQTRGAVIGFVLVLILALVLLAIWYRHVWRFLVAGAVVLALALAALVYTTPEVSNRALSAFGDSKLVYSILMSNEGFDTPAEGVDGSTDQRIAFVRGAWGVFSSHPVFGVGSGQMIEAAQEYFPERYKHMGNHLHSDPGDFAAAAGSFGLVAYLLLLLAPFLSPAGNYGTDTRRAMLMGAVILSGSYLTLGLTNALFGVLPQTVLFSVLLAAIIAMGRTADEHLTRQTPQ